MAKRTLHDLPDLSNKRVLVRVDFNVPLEADGTIANDRRIRAAVPTIRHILQAQGKAIVMSHLGRPKGDPVKDAPFKLERVARRLGELLQVPVHASPEVVGPTTTRLAEALQPGEVLVLENLRFHPGEQAGDEAFARELAALADVYVNDAFGTCHRQDASMVAVPRAMADKPRVVGLLVQKELEVLDTLLSHPKRPALAVLGGAKVSDKIGFIKAIMQRVDRVLIGGAMNYTFQKALGRATGQSRVELDKLDMARELLQLGGDKIILPVDILIADKPDATATTRVVSGDIPDGWEGMDIGPETIARYRQIIAESATIVWNGPMGKFEDAPFSTGTRAVAEAMAQATSTTGAVTVVGGGETAEAVEDFQLDTQMSHVSTGGGAFLEYVEGTPFAALAQIEDK
jgi:phosphoglycerate kinase